MKLLHLLQVHTQLKRGVITVRQDTLKTRSSKHILLNMIQYLITYMHYMSF